MTLNSLFCADVPLSIHSLWQLKNARSPYPSNSLFFCSLLSIFLPRRSYSPVPFLRDLPFSVAIGCLGSDVPIQYYRY